MSLLLEDFLWLAWSPAYLKTEDSRWQSPGSVTRMPALDLLYLDGCGLGWWEGQG